MHAKCSETDPIRRWYSIRLLVERCRIDKRILLSHSLIPWRLSHIVRRYRLSLWEAANTMFRLLYQVQPPSSLLNLYKHFRLSVTRSVWLSIRVPYQLNQVGVRRGSPYPSHLATLSARTSTPSCQSYIPGENFDPSFINFFIETYISTQGFLAAQSRTKSGNPCFMFPLNGTLHQSVGWH